MRIGEAERKADLNLMPGLGYLMIGEIDCSIWPPDMPPPSPWKAQYNSPAWAKGVI